MSATQRLPFIAGTMLCATTLAVLASSHSGRAFIARYLGGWPMIALLFALVNFKALPLMWHVRCLGAIIYHFYVRPAPVPPSSLFEPIITSSFSPILETDYNLHKSNSTYFSDLDISRAHLVSCLLRKGIQAASRNGDDHKGRNNAGPDGTDGRTDTGAKDKTGSVDSGRFSINLGAVSCHFKREIRPYERYEIWTRVLAWDRKWIYLVSHIVKPSAIPKRLRPRWKDKGGDVGKRNDITAEERERMGKAVFATSIAKYVVKKGRLTIAPERVLERSGLLPERPSEAPTPLTGTVTGAGTPATYNEGMLAEAVMPRLEKVASRREQMVEESGILDGKNEEQWTWEAMEKERQRGLKIAEHFAALDELHDVWVEKAGGDALGAFADLLGFI